MAFFFFSSSPLPSCTCFSAIVHCPSAEERTVLLCLSSPRSRTAKQPSFRETAQSSDGKKRRPACSVFVPVLFLAFLFSRLNAAQSLLTWGEGALKVLLVLVRLCHQVWGGAGGGVVKASRLPCLCTCSLFGRWGEWALGWLGAIRWVETFTEGVSGAKVGRLPNGVAV